MTTPKIPPDLTTLFEVTLPGGSAYALLKKFGDGEWSAHEVAHVISFAEHGPTKELRLQWGMAKQAAKYGMSAGALFYTPHPDVIERVTRDGAGNLADQAAAILTDVVFREAPADDDA
ncbi:MAG: hypothetical protein WBA44_05120 [Mesorhizobium sp.]